MISTDLISRIKLWYDDPKGWCYAASEALYYLAGGKEAGIKPMRASIEVDGYHISHWWLQDEDGSIVDVTADQFDFAFPYELGKGCGFQTKIKNDTKEIMEWVKSNE